MDSLSLIAEQKIAKAMQERDFNSPNWKNKPLPLDDDRFVITDDYEDDVGQDCGAYHLALEVKVKVKRPEMLSTACQSLR